MARKDPMPAELEELAARLRRGESYEDLESEVDALVGTTSSRDRSAEAEYERRRVGVEED